MQTLTREWISKAEGDYGTMVRELQVGENYDAVCFHAQQCVEKYLKARLQESNIPFQRTHDLVELLNLLLPIEPHLSNLLPELHALNLFAVDVRYPGEDADEATALEAQEHCNKARIAIRQNLNLW